jgi:DNA-binding response OmpR family regulator
MKRVILAGLEPSLASELAESFAVEGFATSRATALEALMRELRFGNDHAVVLLGRLSDARTPDALRALRAAVPPVPAGVVVLGEQGDRVERIVALELGADDYLAPPLDIRELALRVRAILRRLEGARGPRTEQRLGRIVIEPREQRVWVDGRPISLSPSEYRMLAALAAPAGVVHSRSALRAALDVGERSDGDRFVDARVTRLRRRLGDAGALLETVRGIGYRLGGRWAEAEDRRSGA